MLSATSQTNLSIVLFLLIAPILTFVVANASYLRSWETVMAHMSDSLKSTFIGLAVPLILVLTILCFNVVRTVYADHRQFIADKQELKTKNARLAVELEERENHIFVGDPVFSNIKSLLLAFDMYRHARHGEPCVIWLSLLPGATSNISGEVAQFSNSVSDCFTFGPFPGGEDPENDQEAIDGMIPDAVVFHADKNDKAAFQLFGNLSSLIKMQRSNKLPPRIASHYQLPPGLAGKERTIWLQFGPEVKWNSQLR
jgi:hypothetical protein